MAGGCFYLLRATSSYAKRRRRKYRIHSNKQGNNFPLSVSFSYFVSVFYSSLLNYIFQQDWKVRVFTKDPSGESVGGGGVGREEVCFHAIHYLKGPHAPLELLSHFSPRLASEKGPQSDDSNHPKWSFQIQ